VKKHAVITGAHGFLGRYTARHLANAGYLVTGIGHGGWDRSEFSKFGLSFWHSADVCLESLITYAGEPDLIVHCAGSGSVSFSITQPFQDYNRTVTSTASVLEYIRLYSPATILVYPSSAAVYGEVLKLPINEKNVLGPVSPYGMHKLFAEYLCGSYARNFGVSIAIVRFFSLYGEGLRKQLLWDACCQLQDGNSKFFGTGAEIRDWLHVEDAAGLLSVAAKRASNLCPIVNGGSGVGVAVRKVIDILVDELGSKETVTFSGAPRSGDPSGYEADISRAREWGWNPTIGLEDGGRRYAAWFKEGAE